MAPKEIYKDMSQTLAEDFPLYATVKWTGATKKEDLRSDRLNSLTDDEQVDAIPRKVLNDRQLIV